MDAQLGEPLLHRQTPELIKVCENLKVVRTILDLPCGGGRVLRFLVHRFPKAEVTACELATGAAAALTPRFTTRPGKLASLLTVFVEAEYSPRKDSLEESDKLSWSVFSRRRNGVSTLRVRVWLGDMPPEKWSNEADAFVSFG